MEFNDYVMRFIQIVREVEGLDLFSASSKLTKTEFRILREIVFENDQGKDIISSELARRVGVTRSAISQIVNKMEKQGVIKRVSAENDKKIAYVRLSERTHTIYEEQLNQIKNYFNRIVEIYGREKMDAFLKSCSELTEVFTAVRAQAAQERSLPDKNAV